MSTNRLNANFQQLLRNIYNWPTLTIEKSTVIQMLEELSRTNPELHNTYDDASILTAVHQFPNHQSDDYSQLDPTENHVHRSPVQTIDKHPNHKLATSEPHVTKKETTASSPNNILVKEGDLTVRKGSTILSPLLKKLGSKALVYCELSYTYCEKEKIVYFTVYQNRKTRKFLHKFIIDDTCSFVPGNKREFQFKHNSNIENFTTETGGADTWISSLNEISIRQQNDVEEVYENPEDFVFTTRSSSSSLDPTLDTPLRPPPRPPRTTNSLSPESIYVCLYNHHCTTDDSIELEFNCGDLLYIINTDGPTFYVGRRLISPLNNYSQGPIGLVFKDYIKPAYEKVY